MKTYEIPLKWISRGSMFIEAKNLGEAIEKAMNPAMDNRRSRSDLFDYIEGPLTVNAETINDLNEENYYI